MRSFRLFVFFLVGALLSGSAVFAFAGDRYTSDTYSSAVSKCMAQRSNWVQPCAIVGDVCPASQNSGSCSESARGQFLSADGINTGWVTSSIHYDYCSDSFPTWNGNTCVLDDPCKKKAGYWDNGGSPMSVNLPGPLPFYSGETGGSPEMPNTICLNGCVADTTQDRGEGMSTSSWWGYNMNPKYTGQSCSPGTPKPGTSKPKTSPEYDCVSKGQGFGYVNGVVLCVKPDTSSGAGKKTTEVKNADGTTTKTSVDKTMTCTGAGSCTTTTTTTTTVYNADGTQASTKSESQKETSTGQGAEGSGFCKENPSSPMCKTGSFSGSCEAAPSCEGDPIQCATAKATWETNCKTMKPGEIREAPDVGTKKIQQNFEHADLGGGGSCPAPRPITLMARTIYFEMTPICEFASGIRPVVILLGWIAAGYIVMGYGRASSS